MKETWRISAEEELGPGVRVVREPLWRSVADAYLLLASERKPARSRRMRSRGQAVITELPFGSRNRRPARQEERQAA